MAACASSLRQTARPLTRAAGEVIYEGPNVMLGYANSGAMTSAWATSCRAHSTPETSATSTRMATCYLVGREKRIAKVFGHRVSLDEVEALLAIGTRGGGGRP